MLRRRAVHKDMADINGYAAKRLKDMAQSLDVLAKTFGKAKQKTYQLLLQVLQLVHMPDQMLLPLHISKKKSNFINNRLINILDT